MYNDFLLIRKMKQGDDNAFDLFVHKYYQEILSYCYHHCFDQTYAEDFTQETFIRFFSKLPDYHYKGKTLNYLYTIAGNLCKDYLKKTKEMLLEEIELVEENQTEQILNRVLIEQVLEQLPDESREVLTLYYFQELKLTEISDTLQIGLPLVKYRLQKARKQLRELLGKEEFDESKRKDKKYRESIQVEASEEKIQETICKSKNAFFMAEQERMLSYHDFLWTQLRVIQKRWWVLQFMILVALWIALSSIHDEIYLKRSMGVVATLFVILIIPELWKNRSCECMEIEAASYYSLKQVYATRMLLFGITDIFFITVFLEVASAGLHYELSELVVQFLFPLCVTACICFGILCSKHAFSETVAIVLCVIWSAVWLFIVLNENVYIMVTVPIWSALLGVTILFIAFAIYRILKNCNQYLEVSFDEIRA